MKTVYEHGKTQAMLRFGVKRSSLTQPGTPKTNFEALPLRTPNAPNIPDAGTGYATSGAQYGAETRK